MWKAMEGCEKHELRRYASQHQALVEASVKTVRPGNREEMEYIADIAHLLVAMAPFKRAGITWSLDYHTRSISDSFLGQGWTNDFYLMELTLMKGGTSYNNT